MLKPVTQSDYHVRVEKMVDLIRREPSKAFTVRQLASEAAFSEFHFQRIFKSIAGETIAGCIARLRIEQAAGLLTYDRLRPITDIALSCGFSSSANFAKAFRNYCGCSPTQFRQNNRSGFRISRIGKAKPSQKGYPELMSTDVDILLMPSRNLASLRQVGPYNHQGINQLFSDLSDWHQNELGYPAPDESIGITWSDSALAEKETWRYDACFEVPKGTRNSGRVITRCLAEGWVARLPVSLAVSDMHRISDYWDWFVSAWIPAVNAELADHPSFESYRTGGYDQTFSIMLCLPLKRKPDGV